MRNGSDNAPTLGTGIPAVEGEPWAPLLRLSNYLQRSDLLLDCCNLIVCRIAIIEGGEVGGFEVAVVGDQGDEVQGIKPGSLGSRGDSVGQSEDETRATMLRGSRPAAWRTWRRWQCQIIGGCRAAWPISPMVQAVHPHPHQVHSHPTPARLPHRSQLLHGPAEARSALLLLHCTIRLIIVITATTQLALQPLRLRLQQLLVALEAAGELTCLVLKQGLFGGGLRGSERRLDVKPGLLSGSLWRPG